MHHNRRTFLRQAALLSAAGVLPFSPVLAAGASAADPLDPPLVKEFVGVAHNNLDRLLEILNDHPLILNAAWDWGDGDFETALGAAGHVGRPDIAGVLLERGARADIFVLTMLGETEIVKATLERFPHLLNAIGPHGFTLLHHAKRGGEAAQNLLDYLTEKGLSETFIDVFKKKKN